MEISERINKRVVGEEKHMRLLLLVAMVLHIPGQAVVMVEGERVGVESDSTLVGEVMVMVGAENYNNKPVVMERVEVVQYKEVGVVGVLYKALGTEVEVNEVAEVKSICMPVVEEKVNLAAEVMSICMLVVEEEGNLVEEVVVNYNSKAKGVEANEQAAEVENLVMEEVGNLVVEVEVSVHNKVMAMVVVVT